MAAGKDVPDVQDDTQEDNDNESGEEEEEEVASSTSEASTGAAGGGAGKKKKKKKKNKKKKQAGDAASTNGDAAKPAAAAAAAPKVDKAESERKFQAALAALKADDLWVDLGAAALSDAKVKKLLEPLKKNESVTSLNLSQNALTDEGAKALAAALNAASTVPGLITLDVRENNFTEEGNSILEGLKKSRRNLNIMTGPMTVPEPPAAAKPGAEKALNDLSDSRLVRKYFQIGEEEEEVAAPPITPEPVIDPAELWQQLDEAVSQGVSTIPTQQGLLKQLCHQLQVEVNSLGGEYTADSSTSMPHTKASLEHLHTLDSIMGLVPPPVTVQYSKSTQAAVGSHRVLVTEALAHLLCGGSPLVDQLVSASQLLPKALHLALQHPMCSPLHERALRCVRCGLYSKVDALLKPVVSEPGWGLKLPALKPPQGSEANSAATDKENVKMDSVGTDEKSEKVESVKAEAENGQPPIENSATQADDAALCAPLPEVLATFGAPALGVVGGMRSPLMGFVIAASKLLHQAHQSTSPNETEASAAEWQPQFNEALSKAISENTAWQEFAQAAGNVFEKLASEQEGDLGGPRAVRPTGMMDGAEMPELAGGTLFNGQEILALLHGMSLR